MISIRAQELGKAYKIYSRPIDSLKELLLRRTYHETFWALQGVDIELPHGGSLGVIGENGAGKSTLLKLLAGTMEATSGSLERNGRISAILELGSGFHPDLTGEDNIRIGCAVLGLSPAETEERIPQIISFSELGDFIQRPVKTYSSGMCVRLGFSVVTSVDPDILVVDEALSVGDQHFRKKCIDRMAEFLDQGKTIIFCSHDLYYIKQVCDQCLWLRNGQLEMLGPTMEVAECYQDYERGLDGDTWSDSHTEPATPVLPTRDATRLSEVSLGGDCRDGTIQSGERLTVRIVARLDPKDPDDAHIGLKIVRNDGVFCYGLSTEMDHQALYPMSGGEYGVTFVVERLPLLAGQYRVDVGVLDGNGLHPYAFSEGAGSFRVKQGTKELGLTRLSHRWEPP